MTRMTHRELASAAYEVALSKGFSPATWENFPVKMLLALTEADELRDEVRQNDQLEAQREIADIYIRVSGMLLGIFGNLDPVGLMDELTTPVSTRDWIRIEPVDADYFALSLLKVGSAATEMWRKNDRDNCHGFLSNMLTLVNVFATARGMDLQEVVMLKTAINAKRPYLHGNKSSAG